MFGGTNHKPKPFQRPGITLSTAGAGKKSWQTVDVETVRAGDIVRGLGLVMDVKWWNDERGARLQFKSGKVERYNWGDKVIAFTEAEGEPA